MFVNSGRATPTLNGVPIGTVEGQVSQDVTATADSISVLLAASHSVNVAAEVLTSSGTESDSVGVDFNLTSLSEATFLGGELIEPGPPGPDVGELLDSQGNVILMIPNSPFGVTVLQEPGSYELSTGAQVSSSGSLQGAQGTFTDLQGGVTANFTAVPEPSGAVFAVLIIALLGACFAFRRRAA